MLKLQAIFSLAFYLLLSLNMQAQCPGCIIDLPALPEDTVYISDAPDGEVGVYYNDDISFRMPMTTGPVQPGDAFPINSITVLSVTNLPPGMSWEASQLFYQVDEGETDGCVKFCGTPLVADTFYVEVVIEAQVSIISQTASFSFPMYIAPANSSTEGFSMTNNIACGETTVSFENNIPSNGNPGVTYAWDFGLNITSNEEFPPTVTYDNAGFYEVNYEATIDTVGFLLTNVTVSDADCSDIIGEPDFFFELRDPANELIFTSNTVDNLPPPVSFDLNIALEAGDYTINVFDSDLIGNADCGNITFDLNSNGSITNGDLTVDLNIINPITTVTSVDTVFIYTIPDAPVVTPATVAPICEGESVTLTASYDTNVQWYQDTIVLLGETNPTLTVNQAGGYYVEYTSDAGCNVFSEVVLIEVISNPSLPVFSFADNILTLVDPSGLPTDYSLQWYLDEQLLEGETETTLCITEAGNYTLSVTDNATGCSAQFSSNQIILPNIDCSTPTNELQENTWNVYPNPMTNALFIAIENAVESVEVYDIRGALWYQNKAITTANTLEINTTDWAAGIYLVRVQVDGLVDVRKVVK